MIIIIDLNKKNKLCNLNFSYFLVTADSVKSKWENLRKCYVRAHKKAMLGEESQWYLYDRMKFLENHIKHISSIHKNEYEELPEQFVSDQQEIENLSYNEVQSKHADLPSPITGLKNIKSLPTPPVDKFAKEKELEEKKVEKKISDAVDETIELVKKISAEETALDSYLIPVKEALKTVKPNKVLTCMIGVLKIINKYRKM